ncbi:hypothetical protein B0I35DRAFT_430094 [Stachybotrys elegans]|uniref:BIR-domain-containing protein n=1 Tax=Stachybotrys elegans TaxID=80388 RepID=A0A8K0SSN4_9HYPO|nr:hypothetical protein B0I35DRAFT_430094 [Stachybotrys elegans]
MASPELHDQYFTYEGRLASFQKTKKRASGAGGRGAKPLNWPHKSITPDSMARAGFFFNPAPTNPDNAMCFLCQKGLDGWEAGDDPLLEHIKHSPTCGWAIVAAIEAEVEDFGKLNPADHDMVEARKATFAGRWPHEGKKGWKCKTKQLVDAGWKYTPTPESDDMATCTYCQLALDGWEPNDKPLDEHYNRSPDCPFFTLVDKSQATKKSRTKTGRASKTSRLSVQSVATVASEAPSVSELTTGPEDSVLTTTSTMAPGTKKPRAKKATAAKGRKTKAKKEDVSELPESHEQEEEAHPLPKASRGKKRGSEAIDASVLSAAEIPAPKRQAIRARGTTAVDSSMMSTAEDVSMSDAPAPKKPAMRKKSAAPSAKRARNVSAASTVSNASEPSLAPSQEEFPDDDEIERQLQADLDMQHSDDEPSMIVRREAEAEDDHELAEKDAAANQSRNYAMFNPGPVEVNEEDIDDELKALQAEMEVEEPEQQLHIPKKNRKAAGDRRISESKTPKDEPSPPVEEDHVVEEEPAVEEPEAPQYDVDVSMGSTDTVVKKEKRGRGRPSKASLASRSSLLEMENPELATQPMAPPPKRGRGRPSKASLASQNADVSADVSAAEVLPKRGRGRPSKKSLELRKSMELQKAELSEKESAAAETKDAEPEVVATSPEPRQVPASPPPPPSASRQLQPHSTPMKIISPAPSAKQAALSPSQSPQSSDAENQPPSSKPTMSASRKRVVLAPVVSTPVRTSPSKRNVLAGLQSSMPWTAVDVDMVFGTPRVGAEKENGAERFLKQGKDLSSPEKRMTVEEWIHHNADEAEKLLKHECETLVSRFESEGTRAMRVLEGLVVD